MPILGFIDSGGSTPGNPVIGTATAGNTRAVVTFTPPSFIGKETISYTAVSSPGGFTGVAAGSPIEVAGLTNGTSYTFTVFGTTSYGIQTATTAPSNAVTPFAPPVYPPYGTLLAANQCSGFTLFNLRADGSGGTYNEILAYNSPQCGYQPPVVCAAYGTFLENACVGTVLNYRLADGSCGSFLSPVGEVVGYCGYVPLPNCTCCIGFSVTDTRCFCPRGPEYTCVRQARNGITYTGGCGAGGGSGPNCGGACNPATCDCSSVAGNTYYQGDWYNTGGPRCYV
jgi:hypothetical protein